MWNNNYVLCNFFFEIIFRYIKFKQDLTLFWHYIAVGQFFNHLIKFVCRWAIKNFRGFCLINNAYISIFNIFYGVSNEDFLIWVNGLYVVKFAIAYASCLEPVYHLPQELSISLLYQFSDIGVLQKQLRCFIINTTELNLKHSIILIRSHLM